MGKPEKALTNFSINAANLFPSSGDTSATHSYIFSLFHLASPLLSTTGSSSLTLMLDGEVYIGRLWR